MNEKVNIERNRQGVYIAIIILLIVAIGGLVFWIAKQKSEISITKNEKLLLENDMMEINNMFSDYGLMIKDDIKTNLDEMLAKYDEVVATSDEQRDSIEAKKNEILSLKEELLQANMDKKSYARKIYKLRKESETLRAVMKNYLAQIDSLQIENKGLKTDLKQTNNQLSQVTNQRNQFEEKANKYAKTIKSGSKLQAYGFTSEGIKVRNSGSFKVTSRAKSTDQIRSCFTVSKNDIAKAGNKIIYMQVVSPSGKVIYQNSSNVIKMDNESNVIYSDKKSIDYQNKSVDICIFYDLKDVKAEKGNYTINIFEDGAKIGSDKFILK